MAEEAESKPVVLVFTGNSNTGHETVKALLAKYGDKIKVRAAVRKMDRARLLEHLDVEIVRADVDQPALLSKAFDDKVNAAFWATPTAPDRVTPTKKFIDACITYGVDFPVIMSVLDADKQAIEYQRQFSAIEDYCKAKAGTPVKKQLGDTGKQVLRPIILRSGFFYQNFFGSLGSMASGTLYYPLGSGGAAGAIPHIDLEDIGEIVAKLLVDPEEHGGRTYNLIGEYQAGNQIVRLSATAISMSTGHNVAYENVDEETASLAFQALGLPEWLARGNVEMLSYFVQDHGQDLSSDTAALLGRPPTKFAAFAKKHIKPLLDQ
ncbi:uncharacterized protein MONBRDRAFT_26452 [Monosiga brevicollis MX1]|uniref:NmrA-like domain-containing protein n=1 Tax=Monosiga brevicollis TaxID=81824 RepID=A9V2E6_MONBE|nr:uncharacterized protein MONBRDRAFT_26452 [Monosiga brevicollis MX1]EDQ88363.1 predicted protein [Monosiga brevicollis MX1]|eukprot:XP_001746956.1 hypothetical protein [Monosiga brevicollis MX1]